MVSNKDERLDPSEEGVRGRGNLGEHNPEGDGL